jgi:hypothetical protein
MENLNQNTIASDRSVTIRVLFLSLYSSRSSRQFRSEFYREDAKAAKKMSESCRIGRTPVLVCRIFENKGAD